MQILKFSLINNFKFYYHQTGIVELFTKHPSIKHLINPNIAVHSTTSVYTDNLTTKTIWSIGQFIIPGQ